MLYLIGCFIFFVVSILFLKWCRVENLFSKGIGLLLVLSLSGQYQFGRKPFCKFTTRKK